MLFKPRNTEGFDTSNTDDKVIYTKDHCPLFSSQLRGFQNSLAAAQAANQFSTVKNYNAMISSLQTQIDSIGCTGDEKAGAVPLALPASITSSDVEALKASAPTIDLTTVPSIAVTGTTGGGSAMPTIETVVGSKT